MLFFFFECFESQKRNDFGENQIFFVRKKIKNQKTKFGGKSFEFLGEVFDINFGG